MTPEEMETLSEIVANKVYDRLFSDLQDLKNEIWNASSNTVSQISQEVGSESSNIRSSIRGIEGQMYSLRRV